MINTFTIGSKWFMDLGKERERGKKGKGGKEVRKGKREPQMDKGRE